MAEDKDKRKRADGATVDPRNSSARIVRDGDREEVIAQLVPDLGFLTEPERVDVLRALNRRFGPPVVSPEELVNAMNTVVALMKPASAKKEEATPKLTAPESESQDVVTTAEIKRFLQLPSLSYLQASKAFGVGEKTVRRKVKSGNLKSPSPGRISVDALFHQALIKKHGTSASEMIAEIDAARKVQGPKR